MIEGFFSPKELESFTQTSGKATTCVACGLHRECVSPKMKPYGNFKKRILNIGEAPGETEDNTGRPWQGSSGRLLDRTYKALGVDLMEDCLNINAVSCRPVNVRGNNREPTGFEVECCRRTVFQVIQEYKPRVVICLGNTALFSLIGHRWKKDFGTITKWRGYQIPDQDLNCYICPTFHPSYLERDNQPGDLMAIWIDDLQQAFSVLEFPVAIEPKIEIIEDLSILRKIKSAVAIDFETTGLKPHAEGHRIACAAVATSPEHVYAFVMPNTKAERQPFLELLTNEKIPKMAHNMKFEDTWSAVRLRTEIQGWEWDSMLAAHILDNRPGVTSLKFQTYAHFGIIDYASEISPYLASVTSNDANSLNRVLELLDSPVGTKKLLTYCALDAAYEYRLALYQQSLILLPF